MSILMAIYFAVAAFSSLYKNTKMNRFGCWLTSIALGIFIPVAGFVNLIYFATHVGRSDSK